MLFTTLYFKDDDCPITTKPIKLHHCNSCTCCADIVTEHGIVSCFYDHLSYKNPNIPPESLLRVKQEQESTYI